MGRDSLEALRAARHVREGQDGNSAAVVVATLEAVHPHVLGAKEQLAAVTALRDQIEAGALVSPLAEAVSALDARLLALSSRLRLYDHARGVLPGLLGFQGPRTYLLLAQDNTELFATGGLISVYALLTLDQGRVAGLTFNDVGQLFRLWQAAGPVYVPPPAPLQRYLLRDFSWSLGTANWSPDFPTAARQVQLFLALEGGGQVDGVIALNFFSLEGLLRHLGPLEMPEYGVTLRPENATEAILEQTHNARGEREGKHTFVAKVAQRLLDRVLSAPSAEWSALRRAFDGLVRQKQLFIYLNDARLQASVQALGWAGEVKDAPGDYLMLLDSSVHSTKLNLVVEQSLDVAVRLDAEGNAFHRVTVRYENLLPRWLPGKSEALRRQMLGGLYGDYVRLLAPRGTAFAELLRDGWEAGLQDVGEEAGRAWFGAYLAVPSGEKASLTFIYRTPAAFQPTAAGGEYRLLVQKQSGTRAIPLTLRLQPPDGAALSSLLLRGQALPPSATVIETDLLTDAEVALTFRWRR